MKVFANGQLLSTGVEEFLVNVISYTYKYGAAEGCCLSIDVKQQTN